jgi:hypothetical protein
MNESPVKEIPLVPRHEDNEAEGCVCDVPVPAEEETADEDLPEARVPGLDRPPRGQKTKS